MEIFLKNEKNIKNGRKLKIFRWLSESYWGIKQPIKALDNIDKAISLDPGNDSHINYKKFMKENIEKRS